MRIPIACTLKPDAAEDRVAEWKSFFSHSVVRVRWVNDHHLQMELSPTSEALDQAADLARREHACCAFFDFSLHSEADADWLHVRVPPESSGILKDFASLASA